MNDKPEQVMGVGGRRREKQKGETAKLPFSLPLPLQISNLLSPDPQGSPDTQVIGESLFTFFASLTHGLLLSDNANKIKSGIIVRA